MHHNKVIPAGCLLVAAFFSPQLWAQQESDMRLILERLDRLEQENRALAAEVNALRNELAATRGVNSAAAPAQPQTEPAQPQEATPSAPLDERVAVQEQRTADLAQSKVEAAHGLPISLTGMVLFNSFLNGRSSGDQEYPLAASATPGPSGSGATLSQSILGFDFQGPRVAGGGVISGELHLDLWGGSSSSLNHLIRLRTADIAIDWKNQSIVVGQDKPIISPRDPTSLAQVAFAPLSLSGNPWRWAPQARFEQRIGLGENSGIRARVGVYAAHENVPSALTEYADSQLPVRPAIEGRFELWRKFGSDGRIELAPGFHVSQTHALGATVPSRFFTVDWLIRPAAKFQLTGMYFTGQDASGAGTLPTGFTIFSPYRILPVSTMGGWAQVSFFATRRLTFNVYSGQESESPANLLAGEIARNFSYAGNAIYRLGSNVLLGAEAAQARTTYLQQSRTLADHYDLALGYLF